MWFRKIFLFPLFFYVRPSAASVPHSQYKVMKRPFQKAHGLAYFGILW